MGIYHVGILAPCCQKPVHDFVQAHDNSSLWHIWAPPIKAVVAVCYRGMCCRCATHPALVLGLPFRMSKLNDCKLSDRANSKQKKRTANWMGTVTHIPIQSWTANYAREEWRVVNSRRERKMAMATRNRVLPKECAGSYHLRTISLVKMYKIVFATSLRWGKRGALRELHLCRLGPLCPLFLFNRRNVRPSGPLIRPPIGAGQFQNWTSSKNNERKENKTWLETIRSWIVVF